MVDLGSEGASIAFLCVAILAILVGTFRNVSWGVGILGAASIAGWLLVSAGGGWLLAIVALVAACLMPSRTRKVE